MPLETLERFTQAYIEAQPHPEVVFAWQGGEPTLMGLDFYKRAIALQTKYRRQGMRILNAFQTNGTLLDEDWCRFFHDNHFLIGLSLDGPRHIHDAYRVDKGNNPTFDRVIAGLDLLQKHQVEFNILASVHAASGSHPLEVYRFLRDQAGASYIQFIPIVERNNDTGFQEGFQVRKRSVTAKQYGEFLIAIFNEWFKNDAGKVSVQIFDVALAVWLGQPAGLCVFSPACGLALALEHNGDLYACDHFVEPKYLRGNIHQRPLTDLVFSPDQQAFGEAKRSELPKYCQDCEVRYVCNGGCPKNRIRKAPDGEPGLNYLCAGYKEFFTHIDRPMRLLVQRIRTTGRL